MLKRLRGGDQLLQLQSRTNACNSTPNINNTNDNNNSKQHQESVGREPESNSGHKAVSTVNQEAILPYSRTSSDSTRPTSTPIKKRLNSCNPLESAIAQISQSQKRFIVATRLRPNAATNNNNNNDNDTNDDNNNNNNNNNSKTTEGVSAMTRAKRRVLPEYASIPNPKPPLLPDRLNPVSDTFQ